MADLSAIQDAIAANITANTGLRAFGQAPDSITPPCAIVLSANPEITYAVTMDGALDLRFTVLVILSDGPPAEQSQQALNTYLSSGFDADPKLSVPAAIEANNTLGGLVHFIQAVTATPPGRIDYSGVTYFGARVNVIAGSM